MKFSNTNTEGDNATLSPHIPNNIPLKRQRYLRATLSLSQRKEERSPVNQCNRPSASALSFSPQRSVSTSPSPTTQNPLAPGPPPFAPLCHKTADTSFQLSNNNTSTMNKSLKLSSMGRACWLIPRPVMISMLNNKAVIYMERQQYDEATKSLHRALKIAEKESKSQPSSSPSSSNHNSMDHTAAAAGFDHLKHARNNSNNNCNSINSKPISYSTTVSSFKDEPSIQSNVDIGIGNHTVSPRKKVATKLSFLLTGNSNHIDENESDPEAEAAEPTSNHDSRNVSTVSSHPSNLDTAAVTKKECFLPLEILSMICNDSDISSESAPSSSSSSSTTGTSSSSASKLYKHRSEYDEGMDYFRQPFRLNDSNTSLDGTILFNLARIAHNQGNLEDAMRLYQRSLLALERRRRAMVAQSSSSTNVSALDEHSSNIIMAIVVCTGHIQYVRGQHVQALNTYMVANSMARNIFGENTLEVAACLNCIGVLHYIMPTGDDRVAMDAVQTSLKQRIALLGEDHIDVGTTWNNVGRIFFQQAKYDVAMDAYRESLRIRRACQGESVDVAATIFNIGQVYHQQEKRDKALQSYHDFLKLAKSHFGEYHRDICIVTTCIGQVLHEKKEYEKALKSFHHALRIGHVALGPIHSEIAITLNKMGNLYYETGDLDSALKAYHEGLKIEMEVLEPGNANVYVTYTNIAEIHKQRSEFKDALKYYEKVLELQKEHNAESLEMANTLSSIGYIRHQMEDFENALEVNQECLRLRREAKGDMDEDVASTLTHIALVLLKLNRHDIALEVLTEAYRVRKTLEKPNTRDLAFTLYNIALIYHHRGSHEQALSFYLATAEVEKDALGKAHRDLSITYYNIGQIYYQRGEMELALEKFNEALDIERECFGHDHPTCARTLNEIGNIQLQLGNLNEMMNCYTKALRIYKNANMTNEGVVVYGLRLWRFDVIQPAAAAMA